MFHYLFYDLLKPIIPMEELPYQSICPILSSIWSKHILFFRNFMRYVDNPDFDPPCIINSFTVSQKVENNIVPLSSVSSSWYSLKNSVYTCHRVHTQVYFWICDQLWWYSANNQPSTEDFLLYVVSMRQLLLHQC